MDTPPLPWASMLSYRNWFTHKGDRQHVRKAVECTGSVSVVLGVEVPGFES